MTNQLTPEVITPPIGYHFASISSFGNGDRTLAKVAPSLVPGPASLLSCPLGPPGALAMRCCFCHRG